MLWRHACMRLFLQLLFVNRNLAPLGHANNDAVLLVWLPFMAENTVVPWGI